MITKKYLIINIMMFQLGWLACVLLGATNLHMLVLVTIIVIVSVHLIMSGIAKQELRLIGVAVLIGLLWESLLVTKGFLIYPHGSFYQGVAPLWIIAMWALLATTINVSMRWLRRSYVLTALLGAIGGPLAFMAGKSLGAVQMPDVMSAILILAVGWSMLMPFLVCLSKFFDGFPDNLAPDNLAGE